MAFSRDCLSAAQEIRAHLATSLYRNEPALLKQVSPPKTLVSRLRNLNLPRFAVALHPAGDVHRIAPEIVDKPPLPNDARNDRPCIDSDPEIQRAEIVGRMMLDFVEHIECKFGYRLGMVVADQRQATHDHVGVADRLYLFKPPSFCESVKRAEYLVEESHQQGGW